MRNFLVVLAFFTSQSIIAQDSLDLDPVTITSSRVSQQVSKTGRSVTIISKAMLETMPSQSIDDILKYAAGMNVQQRGPAGSQADIVLRGGTFQQVLVLLDGMRINDPITGHFSAYFPIVPEQIERIEILKGASAALYGPEAVGGVIHIISKTYAAGRDRPQKRSGNFRLSAGEYGFIASSASLQESNKKIAFSIGAMSTNVKGQTLRGENRGFVYNNLASGKIAFFLKKNWQVFLSSSIDSRDFAAQNFYTVFASDTATEKVKTWWNHARIEKKGQRLTHAADVSYKRTSDHYVFNKVALPNDNRSEFLSVQYLLLHQPVENFSWQAGVNAEQKKIESNDRGDHKNNTASAFGFVSYQRNILSLNAGARYQHDENYGSKFLPQVSASLKFGKLVIFGNAGRSARSADFTERYNNYNKVIVNSGNVGNPDLDAETGFTYEAGATFTSKDIRITTSAFLRDQEDVIDWVPTPYDDMPRQENLNPSGNFALSKNISTLRTSGIEIDALYSKKWKKNRLLISIAATFLNSESSQETPSFYILSHAKTIFQQTMSYSTGPLTLSYSGIYALRNPQAAPGIQAQISREYYLSNLKLAHRFNWLAVFLQVQNLGNKTYSDLLGSRMPGRWTTVGINISY